MTGAELPALNLADLQTLLRRREVSPGEVLDALRARIAEIDPKIDAYLSIDQDAAVREAATVDVALPLGGVPIAIKDIISVAGQPCTCASKMLANYRATYDATVIRKLRAAGAIPFGKMNMDEFAMGSSTENSSVKPTRFEWRLGCRRGGRRGLRGAGHRHRWIDPSTGCARRRGRTQTHLRTRFSFWRSGFCLFPRSSRAPDKNGA